MILGFGEELKTSKRILENLGNLRGKLTNLRILEQLNFHLTCCQHFTGKKRWQNILVCIPPYQERGQPVHILHTPVSRALSTAVSHQSHIHYNLSEVIHQNGSYNSLFLVISLLKKPKFLRIFRNFWEFLENFRHFWKKILELFFWEIPKRILVNFSGIM